MCAVIAVSGPTQAQPFVFDKLLPVIEGMGTEYHDVTGFAQGDLNADGLTDIVLALHVHDAGAIQASHVITLMGNGADFEAPTLYDTTGLVFNQLELVDVDANGALDLVAVGSSTLATFFNDGQGVLDAPIRMAFPEVPTSITSARLDGDEHVDLAAVFAAPTWGELDRVQLLLGNGSGTFSMGVSMPAANSMGEHIAAGDMDGNGTVDLVVSCGGNPWGAPVGSISILSNDGLGRFVTQIVFPTTGDYPGYARTILEDVNADGYLDMVSVKHEGYVSIAGWDSGTLGFEVFLNRGDGQFVMPDIEGRSLEGSLWAHATSGDIDGDGDVDFLGAGGHVLENVGGTRFVQHDLHQMPTGSLIDYDGNGSLDVVSVYNASIILWRNNYETHFDTFSQPTSIPFAAGDVAHVLIAADMDGDGDDDAVTLAEGYDPITFAGYTELRVLRNNGDRSAAYISSTPVSHVFEGAVTAADIDGDGDIDIGVAGLEIFLNNGEGTLTPVDNPALLASLGGTGRAVFGDLDGDGLMEMLVARLCCDSSIFVFQQTSPGHFEPGLVLYEHRALSSPYKLGDTNGDGNLDIILQFDGFTGTRGFAVLAGDGTGGFAATEREVLFPAALGSIRNMFVADFNEDGLSDVVVLYCLDDGSDGLCYLEVFLGQPGVNLPVIGQETLVDANLALSATADFNDDGAPDLLSESMHVLLNDGAGNFELPAGPFPAPTPWQPLQQQLGDVNGDRLTDVVRLYEGMLSEGILVYLNDGDGQFEVSSDSISPAGGSFILLRLDDNASFDMLAAAHPGDVSSYLSVFEPSSAVCKLDFNGDGMVTQSDHYSVSPEVDGLFYATYTYLYKPAVFAQYFSHVDPESLDWNGDGDITLIEVSPEAPFSLDSYYWQWFAYVNRDRIIAEFGIDYYAEWWPESGCK